MDRMARFALTSLATLSLALCAPCRAGDAPVGVSTASTESLAPVSPATPDASAPEVATPRVSHHPAGRRRTAAQSLDESVHRLTVGLDLEPVQQEGLRQILADQYRRLVKLRNAGAAAPADVTATSLAIYEQTKARIRAMLNDEQRKKYSADVPRGDLAPAQADLKHWMDLQEAKRRQGKNDEDPK